VVVVTLTAAALDGAARAGPPVYVPPPPQEKPPPEPPPAPKPSRTKLLVLDLKGNDVDAATTKTIQGVVTTELAGYAELDVISGEDVKQLVQLQAEKSTMGCSDDAGCLAEIADALGAKLVVFGAVGKLSDAFVLNL